MKGKPVPQKIKEEIWIRDEFSCKYCGRTLNWDELKIGYPEPIEEGRSVDKSEMKALCADCASQGDLSTVTDDEKRGIVKFIRDLYRDRMEFEDWDDDCPDPSRLQKKIEDLKEENRGILGELDQKTAMAIAYKKKYDRESKDFDNFRNRQRTEIDMKIRSGMKGLATGIIETLDNLDRAIVEMKKGGDDPGTGKTLAGMETIRKGLMNSLSKYGVEEIDPLGEHFDPRVHEAVDTIPDEKAYRDTISLVHYKGYTMSGSVIRPAKVSVTIGGPARPKEVAEAENGECLEEFEVCEENGDPDSHNVITPAPIDPPVEEIVVVTKKRKKSSIK